MADHQKLDNLKTQIQNYVEENIQDPKKRQELNRKIQDLFDRIRSALEDKTSTYDAWRIKHEEDIRVMTGFGARRGRGAGLTKIEGIGEKYAEQLSRSGVTTIKKLLDFGASPRGRKDLAERVGISEKLILGWVSSADLMRIKGVGEEYTDLLEQAGVDTVQGLAQRSPGNLHQKILEINEQKRLVRRLPSQSEVEDWVAQAKKLPRVISY